MKIAKKVAQARARAELMHGVANALGYALESTTLDEEDAKVVQAEMWVYADRIAKMLGYDKAWSN